MPQGSLRECKVHYSYWDSDAFLKHLLSGLLQNVWFDFKIPKTLVLIFELFFSSLLRRSGLLNDFPPIFFQTWAFTNEELNCNFSWSHWWIDNPRPRHFNVTIDHGSMVTFLTTPTQETPVCWITMDIYFKDSFPRRQWPRQLSTLDCIKCVYKHSEVWLFFW